MMGSKMKESGPLPLDWSHPISELSDAGLRRERAASADERAAVAAALGILEASNIHVAYRIDCLAGGGYRLSGSMTANVAQPCVVTLEAVRSDLKESFDVEFWPNVDANDASQDARILEGRDVERLEGSEIPVGRIVFETISAALDPYPRKAGAEFGWQDAKSTDLEKQSPFAALNRLKDDSGSR